MIEVVVNEKTYQTKFINMESEKSLKTTTWEKFLLERENVQVNLNNTNLYEKIDGSLIPLPDMSQTIVKPVAVNGDWLKIKIETGSKFIYGWIRWRDKNSKNLNITFFI